MKLATWNVNSIRVRLPQLLEFLASRQPDVMCLQETKLENHNFPKAELEAAGYQTVYSGQKTYNGVAILAKSVLANVENGIPNFPDEQKRVIAATIRDLRVICVYIPNGQTVDSDKYQYKLKWLDALTHWLSEEIVRYPNLAVLGDYNIAPEDRDVHDPEAWRGQVLCSEPERQAFRNILTLGLRDSFRLFDQPDKTFSWWDYRMMGFRRNLGLRIDHILLSPTLVAKCTASIIDRDMRKLERPSDHAPAVVTLN
ncbi:MAG: exodeoxyribonuclease III [Thiobacillaceae bacterium]